MPDRWPRVKPARGGGQGHAFAVTFEHKASATETITPMLEKDGAWRVSGYYIK